MKPTLATLAQIKAVQAMELKLSTLRIAMASAQAEVLRAQSVLGAARVIADRAEAEYEAALKQLTNPATPNRLV